MALAKARLVEIKWDAKQENAQEVPDGKKVDVQFNPQTLKLSFSNQNRGGDQPGGTAAQFVGSGTSKMSVELVFDVTGDDISVRDKDKGVREKTEDIAFFVQAKKQRDKKNKRVPPGISFEWGSFIFRGVVDSMEETLEYFSEEGVPLRATISLGMSRQEIEFKFGTPAQTGGSPAGGTGSGSGTPGTEPLAASRSNDSVQSVAGRNGLSGDWKAIASANNIDDPLRLSAGTLLNLNVNVSGSASAGAGLSAGGGVRASISGGGSANLGAGLGTGG